MAQPPAYEIDDSKIYRATITTNRGTIVIDLDPQLAPNTVNHFVASPARATTTASPSTGWCPSS